MRPIAKIRPQIPPQEVDYSTICLSIIGVRRDNGREEWLQDFTGKQAGYDDLKTQTLRQLKEYLANGILDEMGYQELVIREYVKGKKRWSRGMIIWNDNKWLIWITE